MLRFLKPWTYRSPHSQSSRLPTQFLGRSIFNQPRSYASLALSRSPILSTMSQRHGNFDLVTKFKLSYADIKVSKWRSRNSGLSVVHLDYDAPIVNGYFVVPTEIFNDTGCPHTLEHLVFMGSEKYPYKGIIDHLANRGFANGTNAWTDTDHTAYTVATAGEQGFLQILPIYVDHILYPTLTDAGFVTEVHHINGSGEDSGVVYSEMQGRENTPGDLMQLRMQRLINPPGSAYRSETGGLMEALRALTIEQIREYHHTYYVPHNLTLIVAGKLASGTESLLDVVQDKIEPRIVEHKQNNGPKPAGWKRPFVETASAQRGPISETVKADVEFPEKDESVGEIEITFRGPPLNAFVERKAIDVLNTYLTASPVAPLSKEYVETDSPLCAYLYFSENQAATSFDVPFYASSVPIEHLDTFDVRLRASLQRIVDEGLDMDRMAVILNRDERQHLSRMENEQGDAFNMVVLLDALYGKEDGSDLAPACDDISHYAELKKWTNADWTNLIRKYFLDSKYAVVIGKPSAALAERLETEEKARVAAQRESLGPDGLAKREKLLNDAKAEHDKEIPPEVLKSFPVPDVKSISWIPVQSVQQAGQGRTGRTDQVGNQKLVQHINADGSELPFFVQYDHVQSDFVSVTAYLSLKSLPDHLRPYMSVYLASFFSLPVKRLSGEQLSHEEVVNRLDNDTVSYDVNLGLGDKFSELLRVRIKVNVDQYETAVAWLRDLIYGSEFAKDRLQVNIAKVQQSLPELRRDGSTVLSSLTATLMYAENVTSRANGILPQSEFIPRIAQRLQETPEEVLRDFETIRQHMTNSAGIRFSVAGNVLGLQRPRSTWAKYFQDRVSEGPLDSVPLISDSLSEVGKKPAKKAIVVGLPSIESSFVTHMAKGFTGFQHPDWPALRVAAEVLNATESYLWRYIRGSGLAYGAYVSVDPEAGWFSFSLYRSSSSLEASSQARKVLEGLVDGTIELEDTTLDAAKVPLCTTWLRAFNRPDPLH
ncbi:hypothetical protein QCA50_002005 [Cerrena zonata]|uniref:Presequence protease, mitochondrial n=1 Tax=Cerrena zonata TaxID=2478898 RepID=A0AAW0GSA8_9APHY